MLKNKDERKAYLLDENNWETMYKLHSIFTTVKKMELPGTVVIRIDTVELEPYYADKKPRLKKEYRIRLDSSLSEPTCMSRLVDLIGKM